MTDDTATACATTPPYGGVVGVDVGVQGYSCRVQNGKAIGFWPAPAYGGDGGYVYDEARMLAQAAEWKAAGVEVAYVELLVNLPAKMGGGKTNYMRGAGRWAWRIALKAANLRFVEVRPVDWKTMLGIVGEGDAAKTKAVMKAVSTFPDVDFRDLARHPGAVVPSADKAEAALIAWYGEKTNRGDTAEFEAARAAWREESAARRKAKAALEPKQKGKKKRRKKSKGGRKRSR